MRQQTIPRLMKRPRWAHLRVYGSGRLYYWRVLDNKDLVVARGGAGYKTWEACEQAVAWVRDFLPKVRPTTSET